MSAHFLGVIFLGSFSGGRGGLGVTFDLFVDVIREDVVLVRSIDVGYLVWMVLGVDLYAYGDI